MKSEGIFFLFVKENNILFIVLLITLFITIFLLSSTFDQIVKDSIRVQVIGSISSAISKNPNIHQFKNFNERQKFIDQQLKTSKSKFGFR